MTAHVTLFSRLRRNVRWYLEDVVTGVTGKGTLHFRYAPRGATISSAFAPKENPATGLPLLDGSVDVAGNLIGTRRKS
jgi:hypothetical protein